MLERQVAAQVSRMSFSELVVDFLGSLVPGVVFAFAGIVTLGLAISSLATVLWQAWEGPSTAVSLPLVDSLVKLCDAHPIEALLVAMMVCYVVGHIFYRQDPKTPDRASWRRITRGFRPDEIQDWAASRPDECEFPYGNLKGYLKARGLRYLESLVPWARKDPNSQLDPSAHEAVQRTKQFINVLKVRLWWYFPAKCGLIARNEAHVRLMSSMWYVASELIILGCVAAFLCLMTILIPVLTGLVPSAKMTYYPLAAALLGLSAGVVTKRKIEKFFHYQRVREAVFVLETAYTGFSEAPELLGDICPEFAKGARPVDTEGSQSGRATAVARWDGLKQSAEAPPAGSGEATSDTQTLAAGISGPTAEDSQNVGE